MAAEKKIKNALISVFYKENLDPIVKKLNELGVTIYSTGGTQKFIEDLGVDVVRVEDLTSYPSILGGRVKTLHPKIFGGILGRRALESDQKQMAEFDIPEIDLVIVDLYPFEETVASGAEEQAIVEKIDIGGISLIRAAAKNFKDVAIVSSREQYSDFLNVITEKEGQTSIEDRKLLSAKAFDISSNYDTAIFNYFNGTLGENTQNVLKQSIRESKTLRYGENPHQSASFFGNLDEMFTKHHGKELSYNNLLDVDAAVGLIEEFPIDEAITFAILKHNNACGIANGTDVKDAYLKALSCDSVSAFGGVLITNATIDLAAAEEINKLFCEVVIAPAFNADALELLKSKKNRVLLQRNNVELPVKQVKTLLNGVIVQDKDLKSETVEDLKTATKVEPTEDQKRALVFASKIVKHTKSNAIVLAKEGQLLASGTGQTSRVDALQQAIHKAKTFGFDLNGAVMASDAFFPFPDCVEIASNSGVVSVLQPGGSIKDQLSIDFCDEHNLSMVFTGTRHFKH
jgi:phosphoribosylaminoimidazolecarboxamide formyltransferase / IMP cyclohydrolase